MMTFCECDDDTLVGLGRVLSLACGIFRLYIFFEVLYLLDGFGLHMNTLSPWGLRKTSRGSRSLYVSVYVSVNLPRLSWWRKEEMRMRGSA